MRNIILATSLALAFFAADANAAPCKDAQGKFTKCPQVAAQTRCKDASGKFAKCGAPGATPVSATAAAAKPAARPAAKPKP